MSIPFVLDYIPVYSDQDMDKYKETMTKPDFKKLLVLEKKKEEFNERVKKHFEFEQTKKHAMEDKVRAYLNTNTIELPFSGNIVNLMKKVDSKIHLLVKLQNECRPIHQLLDKEQSQLVRYSMIIKMEDNILRMKEKERKKQPLNKEFLRSLNQLPDDVLKLVHSYFTYETRVALLVQKYKPIKIFCSMNQSELKKVIQHIHKKYAPVNKQSSPAWKINPVLHESMRNFQKEFCSRKNFGPQVCILSVKEMKMYLQNLFSMFQDYGCHHWCFDLYRAIIVSSS